MFCRWYFAAAWLGLFGSFATAAEPEAAKQDLPRLKPIEPVAALDTFTLKPGFRIELAAAEPLVADPVAMAFDEHGHLFVVEMIGYSEHREDKLGQVRLLEDADGDGRFDRSTVYARDLAWPTAVACFDGGVFVGVTPDILFLKDTDGDRKADERRVVFTGFGNKTAKLNMQSLMNSFRWGLDNRIHGTASGTPGNVSIVGRPELGTVTFRRGDFSFDPRSLDFRLESGGAQHGMDFDAAGRKYVCSNSHHIQQVMYERRYAGENPNFSPPSPLVDIPIDGAAATVFRLSPDEAWRVIRTRWRVAKQVSGPVEGGGRPSGYFTAATGVTIYDGHVWPSEFSGDAFIADCGSNLVHRKKLRGGRIQLQAVRPSDEGDREFLASTDNWFRPVQMEVGPDGALYIADMYREVIEHPWSLPRGIKQHIDLDSGNDRGRIYRIVPEKFVQPRPPRLVQAKVGELVATLDHLNGWHRGTAARLLYERRNPAAVESLRRLAKHGQTGIGRMSALYSLIALGALKSSDLVLAIADESPVVRVHAVRLSEGFLPGLSHGAAESKMAFDSPLAAGLRRLANDADVRVRYQLGWTLGSVRIPGKAVALATLLRHGAGDSWQEVAALNAATGNHPEIIQSLAADKSFAGSKVGARIVSCLETMAAGRLAKVPAAIVSTGEYHAQVFKPKASVNPDRAKAIEQYRPALAKRGNAVTGKAVFEQRCAVCHDLGGVGRAIGPDLKSTRANGAEKMLVSLIDPHREVAPQYLLFTVHLAKGDAPFVGMIANENAAVVELIQTDGNRRSVRRAEVLSIESTGLSLMPAGLESGLSVEQMADLLAWLLEAP
ncbi:MAG: c-type cytochrome [Verrucomicrobiota bacterium]|nr:c-type cytochrome [Verrucomicrobiota bacterium]